MRNFLVTVFSDRTEVHEFEHSISGVEERKEVDGDVFLYSINTGNDVHQDDKTWRARAGIQIEYHALNGCTSIGRFDFDKDKRQGVLITQEQKEGFLMTPREKALEQDMLDVARILKRVEHRLEGVALTTNPNVKSVWVKDLQGLVGEAQIALDIVELFPDELINKK